MQTLGPFRLLQQLGRGGSGTVYRALDLRQGRVVAVKRLHPSLSRDPQAARSLERELAAGIALEHPNIGKVEALERLEDGTRLVVMPFHEGRTLDRLIVPLPVTDVLRIAREVALGLGHAHAAGVVHCDVKPANLMLSGGTTKILDFGLARLPGEDRLAEGFLGTLEYMSPEAARGVALGPHSDLWSLGVVLYELLSGVSPFRDAASRGAAATLQRIALADPAPLGAAHPHLPGGLDRLLERLLAKRPETRFGSAAAFLAALDELGRGGLSRAPEFTKVSPERGARRTPPESPTLVGRDDEAALLSLYLGDASCRLVTVLGLGGVGKTTLARAALDAQRAARVFDRADFVALEHTPPGGLLPALADVLGLDAPTADAVARTVGGRRHLLVLDNLEQLTPQAATLADLLARCSRLTLLVTSRVRLDLDAEWVLPLGGLTVPPEGRTRDLRRYGAAALFERVARQRRAAFDLNAEGEPVAMVCRLLEGHPLGLTLAAAWADRLGMAELLAALYDLSDAGPLSSGGEGGGGRQGSLWRVFRSSERLLGPAERALLARLGVFADGFEREAAQAVVGADEGVLASLQDRSLLERTLGGRYRQHPALAQFCAERFAALPEAGALRRRHGRFYRARLTQAYSDLSGTEQERALALTEGDYPNLRAAALERRGPLPERVAEPLRTFLTHKGRFAEGDALFGAARGRYARACAAWFALLGGRLAEAEALAERALARPDAPTRLLALNVRAGVRWRQGDLSEARTLSLEVLGLARTLGDERMEAICTPNLALLEEAQGDIQNAKDYYTQSLHLSKKRKDWAQTVLNLNNLAELHLEQGDPAAARPLLEEALVLCEQHALARVKPSVQGNLGLCLFAQGDAAYAVAAYEEAHRAFTERGDKAAAAAAQAYLGQALAAQGSYAEAERALLGAIKSARAINFTEGMLSALVRYGDLLREKDPVQARALALAVARHPQSRPSDRALAETLRGADTVSEGDLEGVVSRLLAERQADTAFESEMTTRPVRSRIVKVREEHP